MTIPFALRDIMKRYLRRAEFFSFEHFYLAGIPPEELMLREG